MLTVLSTPVGPGGFRFWFAVGTLPVPSVPSVGLTVPSSLLRISVSFLLRSRTPSPHRSLLSLSPYHRGPDTTPHCHRTTGGRTLPPHCHRTTGDRTVVPTSSPIPQGTGDGSRGMELLSLAREFGEVLVWGLLPVVPTGPRAPARGEDVRSGV